MANKPLVLFQNDEFKKVDSNAQAIDFLSVNGRDVAADGTALDNHVASTANPHSVTKTQVGLANVTNDAQLKAADLDNDTALAADSATKIPSQHAVKAYVDAAVSAGGTVDYSDSVFRIHDNGDASKKLAFEVAAISASTVRTVTMPNANVNLGLIASAIQSSEKGANSGVATLDSGGKIPVAQLPNSVMEFQGNWNASTNSPTLADGTGSAGDVYRVNVAGSQNLGSGSLTFVVGDWAVYNGSIWEKSHAGADAVLSVNGASGVVVLTTSDIAEGSNLYYTNARFDTRLSAKSTADLAEGSNLYFTNARAIAAPLTGYTSGAGTVSASDSILQAIQKLNGNQVAAAGSAVLTVNSVSPSSGNVLLTTANISENTNLYFTDTRVRGAVLTGYTSGAGTVAATDTVLQAIQKLNGNILLKQDIVTASSGVKLVSNDIQRDDAITLVNDNAGSITARQVVYVKSNGNADLALDTTSALASKMLGLVEAASIATTASGKIMLREGALVSGFSSLTPGAPVYIGASAGASTQTAPTAAGTSVYQLGMAVSATQIIFRPRHIITNV